MSAPNTGACQQTYPLLYGDRPYVVLFGESGGIGPLRAANQVSTFQRPTIIDISDETRPLVVTTINNEVSVPSNYDTSARSSGELAGGNVEVSRAQGGPTQSAATNDPEGGGLSP